MTKKELAECEKKKKKPHKINAFVQKSLNC